MSRYDCSVTEVHFNGMILSHAYYSFAQKVTPDIAGRVLYQVVTNLGKEARYVTVANAFVSTAASLYPPEPEGRGRRAPGVPGRRRHGSRPADLQLPAPPPSPRTRPAGPRRSRPRPDARAADTGRGAERPRRPPGAANSALSAVGLTLGSLTDVTDNTCSHIGTVVSQFPTAGTLVAPGTAVNVTIAQLPPNPHAHAQLYPLGVDSSRRRRRRYRALQHGR